MTEDELRESAVAIRVVNGAPNAEEIAALTAVLSAAFEEAANSPRRVDEGSPSGWRRTQLGLRGPLPTNDWVRSGWLRTP